jgi:hypothetical protein
VALRAATAADDPDAFWNLLDQRASRVLEAVSASLAGPSSARPWLTATRVAVGQQAEDRRSLAAHAAAGEQGRLGRHLLLTQGNRSATVPGKSWFAYFRLNEAIEANFDRGGPRPFRGGAARLTQCPRPSLASCSCLRLGQVTSPAQSEKGRRPRGS